MFTDWALASLHHLAIFTLAATIAAELAILMGIMDAKAIVRLTAIDAGYGAAAVAVVIFGVCRVIWGAKGYEYYLANHIFWTKMALFLIVGLLSIRPTSESNRSRLSWSTSPPRKTCFTSSPE